jgi:succinyl-CoA synthetase beta subunit
MATMDLINSKGENPANFMDLSGRVMKDEVIDGISKLILKDNINVILINIFGGIIDCHMIKEAIISSLKDKISSKPIVVRFNG